MTKAGGDYAMTNKLFSFDSMKGYGLKYLEKIPIFVYIPISIGMTLTSLILIITVLITSKQSGKNHTSSLLIPMSSLNRKKCNNMKICFIVEILLLFVLVFLLSYSLPEVFSKNKGVNIYNGVSMVCSISVLVLAAFLLKNANDMQGMQHQIADGSG